MTASLLLTQEIYPQADFLSGQNSRTDRAMARRLRTLRDKAFYSETDHSPPPKVLHTTQISYTNFPRIRHLLRKYGNSETYRTCEEEKPASNIASWNLRTRRQSTKEKPSSVSQASERYWVFLVVQWLRVHLPMQGTGVQSLVQEDPTCRATKPMCHNYWTWALEPVCCNCWSHTLQPVLHKSSHGNEDPVHHNEEQPPMPVRSNKDLVQPINT